MLSNVKSLPFFWQMHIYRGKDPAGHLQHEKEHRMDACKKLHQAE
jgi:hypothetical protein